MAGEFVRREKSAWGEGGALKEEIVNAAARLLAEAERESDLSLRAVAREVGIAAPSIYLHFKDRTELLHSVSERLYRQVADELRAARQAADAGDPVAGLRAVAHRYCSYIRENRLTHKVLFNLERMPTEQALELQHPIMVIHEEWRAAAEVAQPARGPEAASQTAILMWISMHGLVNLAVTFPAEVTEVRLEETVDLLLTQLLKP